MPHHLDPREAQEVVRLATLRNSQADEGGPTVEGLAEALDLSPYEVERMLVEIRSREAMTVPAAAVAPRRIFGDRSAAISAAIVLALLVFLVLFVAVGLGYARRGSTSTAIGRPTAPPLAIDGGGGSGVEISGGGVKVSGSRAGAVAPPMPPDRPVP